MALPEPSKRPVQGYIVRQPEPCRQVLSRNHRFLFNFPERHTSSDDSLGGRSFLPAGHCLVAVNGRSDRTLRFRIMGRGRGFRTSFRAGLTQRPPRRAIARRDSPGLLASTLAEFGVGGVVLRRRQPEDDWDEDRGHERQPQHGSPSLPEKALGLPYEPAPGEDNMDDDKRRESQGEPQVNVPPLVAMDP